MTVERRHDGSAAATATLPVHPVHRGPGSVLGLGRFLRAAGRRGGGAARQELYQPLQDTSLRSSLDRAAAPGLRLRVCEKIDRRKLMSPGSWLKVLERRFGAQ